jgi:hypothetical protein
MAFKKVYGYEILISEIDFVLLCATVRWKNRVIRVRKGDCGKNCTRAKMEMLGIMGKAKNMVFQPQYAQCFTATTSLPDIICNTKTHHQC